MTNPLHASFYADQATQHTAEIVEHVMMARDTFRIRLLCPEIAQRIVPGQFLMLRLADTNDPLIGRPLAMYNVALDGAGRPAAIDVVYVAKGKLTTRLAKRESTARLDIWGPLGNGFAIPGVEHLIMVAGGIGQTPFVALAQEALGDRTFGNPPREATRVRKVTLCYGARSSDLHAGVEDFERSGVDVRLCTDDGSRGHHGLVTDLLQQVIEESDVSHHVVCCGPEPMMQAVAELCGARDTSCQVSLETPMACGIGICFTCVAKVKDDAGQWDYKRTCVDGPVFDAQHIVW